MRSAGTRLYEIPGFTGVFIGTTQKTSYPAPPNYNRGVWNTERVARVGVFLRITGITNTPNPVIQLVGFSSAPAGQAGITPFFNAWEGTVSAFENFKSTLTNEPVAIWFKVFAPWTGVRISGLHYAATNKIGLRRGLISLQRVGD